ncbi:MAG: GNAT family N-acetyltransferase [Desulfamplus sp.]|nr:GNAT family N-acetyltransferase [Desulfamplus sp.]
MDTINSNKMLSKIAFISQRVNVCSCVLELSIRENISFSHFISLDSDSENTLDLADTIEHLGSMHNVESILVYLESIPNIRKFMSAARSVSRVKPIIVLKSGRTGDLAYIDSLYDAAFKRAGILRVNDFQEMFDCARFIAIQKLPTGSRLTIVTNSTGAGVMAMDALVFYGMKPSEFNSGNPVNIPVDAAFEIYLNTVRNCVEASETDALLLIYMPPDAEIFESSSLNYEEFINHLSKYLQTVKKPVFTAWMGGGYCKDLSDSNVENIYSLKDTFSKAGVITYNTPERGVRAFANLCEYTKNIEMLQQIPVRKDKRLLIDHQAAKSIIEAVIHHFLLAQSSVSVNQELEKTKNDHIMLKESDAIALIQAYGIPVKLKESGSDIEKADYELMISAKLDSAFGPVISFGIGGVMTDIVEDIATALPPLDSLLALRLMEETRISRVFKGYRHIKPLNEELIEDMLIRLSRLVTDFPEIEDIQINPVVIRNGESVVTGVQAYVKKSDIKPSMHLVISSYPFEYESEDETIDHEKIFIRPIKPNDAPLVIQHFLSLSPKSVYYRFFTPLKQISQSMLIRLTQIDYDREIALIALMGEGDDQIMVGVARVIFEHGGKKGEFSVVLGDKWHGKGIGLALLKRCLSFASKKGLETVWGIVLAENRQMLKLAKKLGFKAQYVAGSSECEIEIDLEKVTWE